MPQDTKPKLTADDLRQIDRSLVHLNLDDDDVEALLPLLNGLLDEIGQIRPEDREGAEPECDVEVEIEEWTS